MKSLILIAVLLFPVTSNAALTVDSNSGTAVVSATATGAQSGSFTNTAGTLLICGIASSGATNSPVTVSSVAYNSVSMNLEKTVKWNVNASTGGTFLYLYSLLSPATG